MGYLLRIIIFVVLGWLAWRLVRQLMATDDDLPKKSPKQGKIEVIPCAVCGVHIPHNEALMHNNKAYCCTEHLESDKQ